jgi:serine/threonine protein kinase
MVGELPALCVHGRSRAEPLELGDEIDSGEFGVVYALAGSRRHLALKVYKRKETANEVDQKIGWMISLRPPLLEQQHRGKTYFQLAWPHEKVFDAYRQFSGFTMPKIDVSNAVNLEWLMSNDSIQAQTIPQLYSFRLHVAWNLSAVFAGLHQSGVCVIDVKPDNILFYKDVGYVCLLDCDSFIPIDKNEPAVGAGCTPGYILPEAYRGRDNYAPDDFREEQDRFALAVLIFRLMNEGVHPFMGRITDRALASSGLDLQERIDRKLYGYGVNPNPQMKPAIQSRHQWFDDSTRHLFDRAFGSQDRPSAKEWADHLAEYVGPAATKLNTCKIKPKEHVHFGKGCSACSAEEELRKLKARTPPQPKGTSGLSPLPPMQNPGYSPPVPPVQVILPNKGLQGWLWLFGLGALGLFIFGQCVNRPNTLPLSPQMPATTSTVADTQSGDAIPASPPTPPAEKPCADQAVLLGGSLGSFICDDPELLSLNNTDKSLHEQRIQLEGEPRRTKIESDRAALEGLMVTCGAFGPQRECLARMLRNDIGQLQGLIAGDGGQTTNGASTTPPIESGASSNAPPASGTVVAPGTNNPA